MGFERKATGGRFSNDPIRRGDGFFWGNLPLPSKSCEKPALKRKQRTKEKKGEGKKKGKKNNFTSNTTPLHFALIRETTTRKNNACSAYFRSAAKDLTVL